MNPIAQDVPQPPDNVSLCMKISKQIGAIVCLAIMLLDWVAYAEILQAFDNGSFNHLFFIRYCATSGFMLAIIPWYFMHIRDQCNKLPPQMEPMYAVSIQNPYSKTSVAGASYRSLPNESPSIIILNGNEDQHPLDNRNLCTSIRFMYKGTIVVGCASFLCGYTWYGSLDHTFVAANNTVYQSQCVFVLLFSSLILKTKITFTKLFAMLLAVGGVSMVSFGTTIESDDEVEPSWYGYVLCIASTICFSIQTVSTKYFGDKYFRTKHKLADNFLLMSGMGLFLFTCFWPGFIVLHYTGAEKFSLPTTYNEIMTCLIPVCLDAVYTASYMAGVTLGGTVFMSLGALAVIPISFIADVWLHGLDVTMLAVCGSLLIFISFIVIEIPTSKVIKCCCSPKGKKRMIQ
eukprot:5584_1